MYIDGQAFHNLILKYKYARRPDRKKAYLAGITDYMILLAKNIVRGFRFQRVEFDDAIQDLVVLGLSRLKNFNGKKGRAFNFFSTIFINNLRCLYRKEKHVEEGKQRFRQHLVEKARRNHK